MKPKADICCIFNNPSHYRESIYKLMEDELDCDFFFGNRDEGNIKKIDYNRFHKPVADLQTIGLPGGFYWILGSVPLLFKPYKKYILTGEPYCLSAWVILLLAIVLRKKTYLWTHGWYGDETRIKILMKKAFYGMATAIFLYGEYAESLMKHAGFKKEKLHVIYNSLDYDRQTGIRSNLRKTSVYHEHFHNNDPVLIFTGRLTKVKNLNLLVEAHNILLRKGIRINVVLLGDGPEKTPLINLTGKYGLLDRYWFYGECYDEAKIGELYYNAAICVSPGNVGLTSIHAMMYGCPVITHSNFPLQMPEFEAVKENETGLFFKYNNSHSLAEAIESWLNAHTPKQETLIRKCFCIIDDKFNPHHQITILKDVLTA